MKKRIAAVTMCFNEKHHLPRWIRHYSAQVGGYENLYVFDHGSDDGSTDNLGPVNVRKLSRSDGEGVYQKWRVEFISDCCAAMLDEYDFVLYTDTDELVAPDPVRFRSLYTYVSSAVSINGTAIGYDILHDTSIEGPLDNRFVGEQRSVGQLVAAVCKPVLISQPTRWSQGFHGSTMEPAFGDLYLFHMRYADQSLGHQRLAITRAISRPEMAAVAVDHHKIDDVTYSKWIENWLRLPRNCAGMGMENNSVKELIDGLKFNKDAAGIFGADYSMRSKELFTIDAAYRYVI